MAKLIFSLNHAFLGEFPLDKEQIKIGRRPSNDIHIDNLAISGEHAMIKLIGHDAFLEDLASTNGTSVNGKQITQHILQHGDIIALGKYQLMYINETATGATPAVPSPSSKKSLDAKPKAESAKTPAAPKPAAEAKVAPQPQAKSVEPQNAARIRVLSGTGAGKEIILNKTVTTLGKPGVQVAVITRRSKGYFITHVEGKNHPLVNGKTIGLQAHAMNNRDVIELAGTKMEFSLPGS